MELTEHASTCDACGTLLADLRREDAALSEPDIAIALKSSTASWKREIAAKASAGGSKGARPFTLYTKWLAAAAAAAAVVLGSLWWIQRESSPEAAFRLLAQAYTDRRPWEFRIAGAAYTPLQVRLGANAGSPSENVKDTLPFAKADALIKEARQRQPENPAWLRASARADLLRGEYSRALATLQKMENGEANPETSADVGLVLLQRAVAENRPEDIPTAVENLTKAIAARPLDPVLRFNRALAYERLAMPHSAIDEWKALLSVEGSGGWADEARKHLARQEELLRQQTARATAPRGSEDAITALASQGFQSSGSLQPDAIAEDLLSTHRDRWLHDLLGAGRSPASRKAMVLLASASRKTAVGEDAAAEPLASQARAAFQVAGNPAGELFAAFQQAYELQRLSKAAECLRLSQVLAPRAQKLGYRWLEAQLQLSMASCWGMQNRFEQAYPRILEAAEIAKKAGYITLQLRTLGYRASTLRQVGEYREAMRLNAEGLSSYWKGEGDSARAYQFYYDMAMNAAALGSSHTATALSREAVELAAIQSNRSVEAMVRASRAELLVQDDRLDEAELEFSRSAEIFARLPPSPSLRLFKTYSELMRAQLDGRENHPAVGLQRIEGLESMLPVIQNSVVSARLWQAKADLLVRAGRPRESDDSLLHILALSTSERAVASSASNPSALAKQVSEAVKILVDRRLEDGDPQGALQLWGRYNPAFRSNSASSVEFVQLTYADLPSGPVVWIASHGSVRVSRIASSTAKLAILSADLRELTATPSTSLEQIRSVGRQLYSYLIEPVQDLIERGSTLYISSDEPFASIPFGILVAGNGDWLADRYCIAYSPPLAGIKGSSKPPIGIRSHLLAVSSGEFAKVLELDLSAVPDLDRDAEQAAAAFPSHKVLSGGAGTRTALILNLPRAAVFHFSGHALVTASDAALVFSPDRSGGSEDRLLWASQLSPTLFRNCRLVVLAACSTGRPPDRYADPSSVMARLVLLAGVPEVVASRWDVDSSATSLLIQKFYENLRQGTSAEESLSSSARSLRRQSAFAHPYYWAAFDVFRS